MGEMGLGCCEGAGVIEGVTLGVADGVMDGLGPIDGLAEGEG